MTLERGENRDDGRDAEEGLGGEAQGVVAGLTHPQRVAFPSVDRPTSPPPARSEDPTRVPCFVCGGNHVVELRDEHRPGHFRTIICRWCTNGSMSPDQVVRWNNYRRSQPPP